jgi:prepilin-type N-terminal cleavage/methylation domain-containing protein
MKNTKSGLSLMEVMITLVIVAIIAGLAYPQYQKMVSRSKQTEAKTILQAIYVAQDLYFIANQEYSADLDALDLTIPATALYQYSIAIADGGGGFVGTASANIDGDPTLDEWQIDHHNRLVNTINDVID